MSVYSNIKRSVERLTGTQIYRRSTPWGLDLANDLRRLLKDPHLRVVFDVGGNYGQTALRFAQAFPEARVYTFEPVSSTFAHLRQKTAGHSRVLAYNMALGSEIGKREIQLAKDAQSQIATFNPLVFNHLHLSGKTELVSISTVDEMMRTENISQIDLLKTDTEGHDVQVLRGAEQALREQRIGMVFVEVYLSEREGQPRLADYVDLLAPHGFVIVGFYDQEWLAPARLFLGNVLFCRADLVKGIG